jgi:hypothetical protein
MTPLARVTLIIIVGYLLLLALYYTDSLINV